MNINTFIWNIVDTETKERIKKRSQSDISNIMERIQPILADVRFNGDAGLLAYTRKHDKVEMEPSEIKASEEEFERARSSLAPNVKDAIKFCAENIRKFHEEQLSHVKKEWRVELSPGVFAGEKVTPISSVGLYAPGGKNSFPSTVLMMCIPAVLAGVPEICIVSPPQKDGTSDPATLFAAEISGVKNVYKAGGAQAIAALAYGTETIPKVAKVMGPCNPFGAAAKIALSHIVDPGMPAGPSESIILSDGSSDLHNTILDLLNEAEHGPDSAVWLVCHDAEFNTKIKESLPDQIKALPQPQRDYCETVFREYGGIIQTESLEQSINICNELAVEHLLVKTKDPEEIAKKIINAGEILIGEDMPISVANYALGVNHTLPTGGMAHSYSCTSIWDFLKRTSIAKTTKEGLAYLSDATIDMASYEGFPAHRNAVTERHND